MWRRMSLVLLVVLGVGLLGACGISGADDDGDRAVLGESGADDGASVDQQAPAADMDVAEESAGSYTESGMPSQISGSGIDRRVIRDAQLELFVSDVHASVRHARELANDHGGFVHASTTRMMSEDEETADLTLEVPSDSFDDVLTALRDGPYVTRVEHEATDSQDVTEEFLDLEARLRNLEATETRFLALLDEAEGIEEILSVEREISRIRGEIEQIQGRLNYLEDRTDNSRIHVTFHPEEETVEIAGQHFTPGDTAREAWNASMEFMGTIGNAGIAVIVFFWWAWPLVLITAIGLRRYQRRRQGQDEAPATTS